jgi:hypothetical protein
MTLLKLWDISSNLVLLSWVALWALGFVRVSVRAHGRLLEWE